MSVSLFTGPNSILGRLKEVSTRSVFYRPKKIYSINKAYELKQKGEKSLDPEHLTTSQKILQKLKVGHLAGLGTAAVFGGIDVARRLAEKKKKKGAAALTAVFETYTFFGLLAGIASFVSACLFKNSHEEKIKGSLDEIVDRYEIKADGTKTLIKEGVIEERKHPSLNQVVLSHSNEMKLKNEMAVAKDKKIGSVYCLSGITGCGKSMTAEAMATDLAQKSKTGKAQYWYASDDMMKENFMDFLPSIGKEIFGKVLGIETTHEKLEKLFAHAILEEDDVVIVLDEAHKLLGSGGVNFNPNNPHHSPQLVDSLKRLFSDKLKTKKCGNIYLVLPSNNRNDQIAAPLARRMNVNIFYDKPRKDERKKLIRSILEREIQERKEKIDIKIDDLLDEDLDKIAEIGTCNLLEKFGQNEDIAYEEAVAAGFGGKVEELRNRPMFNGSEIDGIIVASVVQYVNGGCEGGKAKLLDLIEDSLQKLLDSILSERRWESELKTYFGSDGGNLIIGNFGARRRRSA